MIAFCGSLDCPVMMLRAIPFIVVGRGTGEKLGAGGGWGIRLGGWEIHNWGIEIRWVRGGG